MRSVVWSLDAREDVLEILRYMPEDDPDAAERLVDAIEEAGRKLGHRPTGRPGRVTGTYEKSLVRRPYVIAYALSDKAGRDSLVILRVIHTSRDRPAEQWPTWMGALDRKPRPIRRRPSP